MSRNNAKHTLSRRGLLKGSLAAGAAAALAGRSHMAPRVLADVAKKPKGASPRAKAVIQIWMWGGPSHLDTFDPKPEAGNDYTGPLDSPIETNVSGVRIGQLLPLLAKQMDKCAILRSMTHGINGHETASYMVQTGRRPGGRISFPAVGGIVSYFKGYNAGYEGLIPPYVVITRPQGRFSEAGFLGNQYKPFATGGDPARDPFAVEGVVARGITEQRQKSRRQLLARLNTLGKVMEKDGQLARYEQAKDKAYDLILGDAGKVFDLTQEKDDLRDRYGRTSFGQSCLVARRLVESGVPYVTINYPGWDSHKQHFPTMSRKLPELDKGFATLLDDLKQRGLLESTIVWWTGEFGRGPKVQWDAPWNGGRSHYGRCFSSVVAGGGFKGGAVLGASDDKGMTVTERPIYPWDLIASFYELLGIDRQATLQHPLGMKVPLLQADAEGEGSRIRPLHEIM